MIFGKSADTWSELKGYDTAREINQQPKTWEKTFSLVQEQKEDIQ